MSVWEYEGLIKKAIEKIKHSGCYDIINELVEKAFEKIELNLPANTYITYVPMYKKKEKQIGFNAAELIAEKVAEVLNRDKLQPMEVVSLLIKAKETIPQTNLDVSERIENIKDSFKLKEGVSCPKNVLLVDDFSITAATMKECSRVLKESGAVNIYSFTLAKVV